MNLHLVALIWLTTRELIRRNLGETRFQEICQRFCLSTDDKELLSQVMSRWKPDYALDDIIALCDAYKDRPNIGQVMQAWETIAWEVARISQFRRWGKQN